MNETSLKLKPYTDDQLNTNYFQLILGRVLFFLKRKFWFWFINSAESQTRWTQIGQLSSEKKFTFETDDLVHYNSQNDQIFYVGRKTLTQKRFGIMINLEYIEQVR